MEKGDWTGDKERGEQEPVAWSPFFWGERTIIFLARVTFLLSLLVTHAVSCVKDWNSRTDVLVVLVMHYWLDSRLHVAEAMISSRCSSMASSTYPNSPAAAAVSSLFPIPRQLISQLQPQLARPSSRSLVAPSQISMFHFLQAGYGVSYLVTPATVESLHPLRSLDTVPLT